MGLGNHGAVWTKVLDRARVRRQRHSFRRPQGPEPQSQELLGAEGLAGRCSDY